MPAYSDLHNLRAADVNVNSARGNKIFDISDTNDPLYRLPGYPEAPLTSTDSDSWEPSPVSKGDIARVMFYVVVRYTGNPTSEPAFHLTDDLSQITSSTNFMGRLSTLLLWHLGDPVDDAERLRNERVFTLYQHNRNPFVDHPEWVSQAFHPRLLISRNGMTVTLRWPAPFVSAAVESCQTVDGVWQLVPGTPTPTDCLWELSVPLTGEATFFRLHLR